MERRKDSQEAKELLLALPCDPQLGPEHLQEMANEFVREHFLLTRQLRDYLTMLLSLERQASNARVA